MSDHSATVRWARGEQPFTDIRYSREHSWSFDGGARVRASASPAHVPIPLSDPSAVDPEEAFVAALSSCHMLVFLHLAAKEGFVIDAYDDEACGYVTPLPDGRLTLSRVALSPAVVVSPATPLARADLERLHDEAHHGCFLASALRAEVIVVPRVESPHAPPA